MDRSRSASGPSVSPTDTDLARGAGRVRAAQPPRAAAAWARASTTTGRRGPRTPSRSRRVHPRRHQPGGARRAQAGVPRGRDRHRRQLARRSTTARRRAAGRRRGGGGARARAARAIVSRARAGGRAAACSGSARSPALGRRCARAGIALGDLDVVELNEAFAAQSLACLAEWPDLDPESVNVNGGAIALGHPLGASGARMLATSPARAATARRRLRPRDDVHRRRPGARRRAGGVRHRARRQGPG